MNLNKTEKLLAARKKLKEFQLHKKAHTQEAVIKDQNDTVKKPITQENVVQEQNLQTKEHTNECTSNFGVSKIDAVSVNANNVNNTERKDLVPNISSDIPNIMEVPVNNNQTWHDDSKEIESCTPHKIDNVEVTHTFENNIVSPPSQVHTDKIRCEEKSVINTSSNNCANLQKEQLLQMASEVANILTADEHNDLLTLEGELSSTNELLSSRVEQQKQVINELHIQVAQYSSRISELEAILATKDAEFEARLLREVNPLKEQLQVHAQTAGILVAEKAELSSALTQSQIMAKQHADQVEELSGKLKVSHTRLSEIEKELLSVKSSQEETARAAHDIQRNYEDLNKQFSQLRKEKEDLELDVSELKQKLNLKNTELMNVQQELQEKTALLALNEIRIQQLTSTTEEIQVLEGQHHTAAMLEQQLAQTREILKAVSDEKDEANKQYQSYIQQLDAQQAKLLTEVESAKAIINNFEAKEQSYIQRLADLEKQLQHEKERVQTLLPLQDQKSYIDMLTKNIDELTLEHERLQITLSEKETDIQALKKELQDISDNKDQHVDAAKLAQALESEQLGASRAVSQNHQLKQQLSEMHDAFVTLSNTKLDLTEQLQAERTIGRKLNAQLDKVETELMQLKDQLKEKEQQLKELEKEKLQNAQITDQMQHYQAQSHHAHTLQYELQNAMIYIENLKKENAELAEKLNLKPEESVASTKEDLNLPYETQATDDLERSMKDSPSSTLVENASQTTNDEFCSLEPMKKLEERFKDTMEKVAELTDEKQRLEHLVLQLQGETETIGEYITLYQRQRAVLQERAKEREQAFEQLAKQCNNQQEQLNKLKILITNLIKKKPEAQNNVKSSAFNGIEETKSQTSPTPTIEKVEDTQSTALLEEETKSQILDVLTEIKDCKDVCILEPNIHLCPWCSGKLITV